jgi:hypothetical protein
MSNFYIRNIVTKAVTNKCGSIPDTIPDGFECVPVESVSNPIFEVSAEQLRAEQNADTANESASRVEAIVGTTGDQINLTAHMVRLVIEAFLSTNPQQTAAMQTLAGTFAVVKQKHDAVLAILTERDAAIAGNRAPIWPGGAA